MRRIGIAVLVLALLLTAFCGFASAESQEISKYESDYMLLWEELTNSYPYLPYLEARGLDVSGLRAKYEAELPGLADAEAFAGMLQRLLKELGNFAHLDLVSPELYKSYYSIYVLDEQIAALPEAEPFREILQNPQLSGRYQPPDSMGGSAEAEKSYPPVTVLFYPDCKALHIKISSFAQELVNRDSGVLTEALKKYPETEHILFDITGNTGGSDWYWMRNLVAPFGESRLFSFRNYCRESWTMKYFYGEITSSSAEEEANMPSWVEELGLDTCIHSELAFPADGESIEIQVKSQAKRWLLVDRAVFSAADKFAAFCKGTGWATLVGTRTAGDGLGFTPVLLLLPESGLLLRFAITAGENPDGSMNAASGTTPDILCTRGQTPLNSCLFWIRGT